MPRASLSMLQHWFYDNQAFACKWYCLGSAALSSALFHKNHIPSLTCRKLALRLTPDASACRYECSFSLYNSMVASFLMIAFGLSYRCCYVLFHIHLLLMMCVFQVAHILL